jgi:cellulose synthase operon protein B
MCLIKRITKILFITVILCALGGHVQPVMADNTEELSDQGYSFRDFGYQDRTASSMFGALEYYLPIPENWVLQDGTRLDLVISHSPILKSNRSTMTIIVNGIAVHSTRLDETNQERTTISIDLPTNLFQDDADRADGYVIFIQFFMRLTDLVCEETNNPALWATVHQESTLTINAENRPTPNELALLPYPFIIKNDPQQGNLTFSFSGSPTSEELNTALLVSVYLGEEIEQGILNINVNQDESIAVKDPTIAIGFSPDGSTSSAPSTIAFQPVGDQAVLSIFGESPRLVTDVLRHPDLKEQLMGHRVDVNENSLALNGEEIWPWKSGAATFWQLGVSEQIVRGVGQQSKFLYFKRPAGWQLTSDKIYLDLNLTPSPMLLMNQSGLRVKINGIDVGAISFSDRPDKGDFYRIELPADLLNISPDIQYTDELIVELVFEHQLQQDACEPIYAENAWTTIHSNSYFFFPNTRYELPDLSLFPYPFLDPGNTDPVWFVLPSTPTNQEIAATMIVAQILRKHRFNPQVDFQAYFADDISEITTNAILIGTPARNHWVAKAESELAGSRQGLVQPAVSQDAIGNLKELKAPWSDGKWVLIISGESGLPAIAKTLDDQLPSASLVAVREDNTIEPVFRDVRGPRVPEPYRQVRPTLIPKPATWQIVLGVFVVTALVVLIVVLIYRRRSK